MKLLENYSGRVVREEYEQRTKVGKPSKSLRSSVFLLLEYRSLRAKEAFLAKCLSESEGKFEVREVENENLQQLLILRGDVSDFLSSHDPNREPGGRINKFPKEIESQWILSKAVLPRLLAAGTFVENLRKKNNDQSDEWPWIWLRHQAMAIEGTDTDTESCTELFKEWVASISSQEPDTLAAVVEVETVQRGAIMDIVIQLRTHKNVILEGVAGSGKTHLLGALKEQYQGRTAVLVFHPSTSYEDFVVGLRPQGEGFAVVPGPFLLMCERASRDPEQDYLLFIDEVNRANTARVLGDLLMVIESSKRSLHDTEVVENTGASQPYWEWEAKDFQTVLTDAELDGRDDLVSVQLQTPLDGRRKHLIVPPNLHILGTMNTTDRSVGTIDLALRRRFRWITAGVLAGEALKSALGEDRTNDLAQVIEWHERTNERLRKEIGPDSQLGHSYFFADGASALEVAEALVNQLAEIAHTFNFSDTLVDSIFRGEAPELPGNLQLHQHGKGLGKRFLTLIPGA